MNGKNVEGSSSNVCQGTIPEFPWGMNKTLQLIYYKYCPGGNKTQAPAVCNAGMVLIETSYCLDPYQTEA
jgi:hypothetical protein